MPHRIVFAVSVLTVSIATWRPASAQRAPSDATITARVESLVRQEAAAKRLGGEILIARGDRVVFQHSYGFADWERRVPNSASTRFGIASLTKLITETLVDQLADEGRIDLNAPVSKYIPGFPEGPRGGHPTVRDLLTHHSGVPHRVTTDLDEIAPLHPADIVERVKAKGLLFEPGSAELYSSAGFTCLARIVEIIENKPFDQVLAERIFRPASMTSATGETGEELMIDRALPYRLGAGAASVAVFSAPYKDLTFLTGAGSLYTTPTDLLHFVRALHKGTFGNVAQRQLGAPSDTVWSAWYGRVNGYEGSVDFFPAQDITFIFLSNLQSSANWQIRDRVRAIMRGRATTAIASVPAVVPVFESHTAVIGAYGDPHDPIVISERDGRLVRDGDEVYPIAGGWYYEPVSGSRMRFARDSAGTVNSMITHYAWTPTERTMARVSPH